MDVLSHRIQKSNQVWEKKICGFIGFEESLGYSERKCQVENYTDRSVAQRLS